MLPVYKNVRNVRGPVKTEKGAFSGKVFGYIELFAVSAYHFVIFVQDVMQGKLTDRMRYLDRSTGLLSVQEIIGPVFRKFPSIANTVFHAVDLLAHIKVLYYFN